MRLTTLLAMLLLLPGFRGVADESNRKQDAPSDERDARTLASDLLNPRDLPPNWREHPMTSALIYAIKNYEHVRDHVRDFSCILVKRERIDGRLRDYEYLRTKVRVERNEGEGETDTPLSVYVEFLAPRSLSGRKVLFVEGRNEGKMLVRNGGRRFSYITVRVSPDSEAARRESRYPITELGLINVVKRLVEQARDDMQADHEGTNTEVQFFRNAQVDGRACTHIRVTHPNPDEAFEFHVANIFVDEELKVPVRVEAYTWPKVEGEDPLLLEEYTYRRLKLNVGLTDDDFREELLND